MRSASLGFLFGHDIEVVSAFLLLFATLVDTIGQRRMLMRLVVAKPNRFDNARNTIISDLQPKKAGTLLFKA